MNTASYFFHITNRYYDLQPILLATAQSLKLHCAIKSSETMLMEAAKPVRADYLVMTPDSLMLRRLAKLGWIKEDGTDAVKKFRGSSGRLM